VTVNTAAADWLLEELAALEVQWQRYGAPIATGLEPGISPDQIDEPCQPGASRGKTR
jgi:hypothetical protein